jgi:hypothetical protein
MAFLRNTYMDGPWYVTSKPLSPNPRRILSSLPEGNHNSRNHNVFIVIADYQ